MAEIYRQLEKSPFVYISPDTDYWFYFSSELHMKKFELKLLENRVKISESLTNRFNIRIYCKEISDLALYRKIEGRGFLVKKGKSYYDTEKVISL